MNGSGHLSATAIVGSELEPTAADNLKNLVQECGVSPHKISELLHELPPLRTSQVLIDYYFKSVQVFLLSTGFLLGSSFSVIGPAILYPNVISAMLTALYTTEETMEYQPRILMMFDSCRCYSSFSLLL